MTHRKVDLIEKEIDILGIIPYQPQNIAKGIRMPRKKGQVEAEIDRSAKPKGPLRGKIQTGAPVLYRLIIIKTQTIRSGSLAERG